MTKYTHGHIIPLVGGSVVGTSLALRSDPQWIASWGSVFGANDRYCLQYMEKVPFYDFEKEQSPSSYVDIVTSLPPCAGLSMANTTSGDAVNNPRGCSAPSNIHMYNAAEFAMSKIGPRAMMVENAPTLYSKMGEEFAEKINTLAQSHGYVMSLVKTTSINHGVPQERTRSFFFLWKGDRVPVLSPIKRDFVPFHQFLKEGRFAKSESVSKSKKFPSEDPLWQFIESKYAGCTKQDVLSRVASKRMTSTWNVIYDSGWLEEAARVVKDEKANRWLNYTLEKKRAGKNIMDGSMKLAWFRTQSLMWKSLPYLMHPHEDRWLTVAEGLGLMGFPDDYAAKVSIPTKHSNVICQNVPACTAGDWVGEIVEALDGNREWIEPERNPDGSYRILRQNNTASKNPMEPLWSV
jgi:site-specific DNA-cytosine methylase